jgi:hypothetical protein
VALVGEAAAVGSDRDDAWLGTINQMKEPADAAIPALDQ